MKGYDVLYFPRDEADKKGKKKKDKNKKDKNKKPFSMEELFDLLSALPFPVDAVIVKRSNGWRSPKIPMNLVLREAQGQIENIGANNVTRGIVTKNSFKKGNVAKLLFDNKNYSPTTVRSIEKLLIPPEESNAKITQIMIQTEKGTWILNPRFVPNEK